MRTNMLEGLVLETVGTLPHAWPVRRDPVALRFNAKKCPNVHVSRSLPTATRTQQ